MEMSGQLLAPAASSPSERPRYSLVRRLGGPRSRSGRVGKEKKSWPLLGIEPLSPNQWLGHYITDLWHTV